MVKVSTLFHRVDGFDENKNAEDTRELPNQKIETQFLNQLLEPLLYDPGEDIVRRVLHKL